MGERPSGALSQQPPFWYVALMRPLLSAITFTASIVPAAAVTVSEFDSVTQEQQDAWLAAQVLLLKNWYEENRPSNAVTCLDLLQERSYNAAGGDHTTGVGLYTLIQDEIDLARRRNPEAYQVEDIIFGVVEHECSQ